MDILSILWQSLTITLFVLSMMLIIDYLNVFTRGIWSKNLQEKPWAQILIAALLGIIPGCLGAYTAVSLYVHNIFGMGALVTAMIATSGDEAFFMFSIIPKTAVIITVALLVIAIITGFIVESFRKKKSDTNSIKHFDIHDDEPECICFDRKHLVSQLAHISKLRFILLIFFILLLIITSLNFDHLLHGFGGHDENHSEHLHPQWVGITFLFVISFALFIVLTVSDHFLKVHLVNHIAKKHFLKIFLWTFFTMLGIHFLNQYIDLEHLILDNIYVVLIIAVLIGIIPESGPHLVFIILFASGNLPLSILLASSIVQDGHGSLPLLAESQKAFIKVKLINILVGFIVGFTG